MNVTFGDIPNNLNLDTNESVRVNSDANGFESFQPMANGDIINYTQVYQTPSRLLGRTAAGGGPAETITVSAKLLLAAGGLDVNEANLTHNNIGGILGITKGGTGQTTAAAAFAALSPLSTKGDLLGFGTAHARIPIGANGQVLTADSTQTLGVKWTTAGGGAAVGAAVSGGTIGSLLYVGASNLLAQDNANFFVDYTNKRLGIGTNSPAFPLDVRGSSNAVGLDCANAVGNQWITLTTAGRAGFYGTIETAAAAINIKAANGINTFLQNTGGGRVGIGGSFFTPTAKFTVRTSGEDVIHSDLTNGSPNYYLRCTYDGNSGTYGGLKQTGYGLQFDSDLNFVFAPRPGGGGIYVGTNPVVYAPDFLFNVQPITTSQKGIFVQTTAEQLRLAYDASNYFSAVVSNAGVAALSSNGGLQLGSGSTKIGFNAAPITKPTVSGSRGGNAALQSLITAFSNLGLIIDSTT